VDTIKAIDVPAFKNISEENPDVSVLDVRRPAEWDKSHLQGAKHFPLDFINEHMAEINPSKEYILYCRTGYRSTIASSILKARGYHHLTGVIGTFEEMKLQDMPMGVV
jgi:rhodanese-related sulfurtransferase